jgi:phenylpropionate dioxygenase-like ring-hydroxylating dioxygenase large terminal subunit
MSGLDFWHPVLETSDVGRGCVKGIKLAGHSLAVFRAANGQLGAMEDRCVHRRMKLSAGKVEGDRLVCSYHGWSFTTDGQGRSPSTPYMHACVDSLECADAHGAIWIKRPGLAQPLPALGIEGWEPAGIVINRIQVPLELVIDNFSEVEHTVAAHPDFGFDATQAGKVALQIESGDDWVTVRNEGPAKMPPMTTRVMAFVRPGDQFHSNYTFRFDPPRSSVSHYWTSPAGRERMSKYHLFHYFVPEDEANTLVVTFGFFQSRWPLFPHYGQYLGRFIRRKIRSTVDEDARILENLADRSTLLDGMKLSRFDRVLGMTRERIRRVYRGENSVQPQDSHVCSSLPASELEQSIGSTR